MKDYKYRIMYMQHYRLVHHSYSNSLEEAVKCALELDDELDNGDNGISFVYNNETSEGAMIGNHNYIDWSGDKKELKWKPYSLES